MVIAADYPFLDVLSTMIIFFLLGRMDLAVDLDLQGSFRRDISGWAKAGWMVFLIVLPSSACSSKALAS